MEFLKKNKVTIVLGIVFLGIMIAAFACIVRLVYPDSKKDLYGNRLDGIENVSIHEDKITEIKQTLIDTGKVNTVTYDLKGKLANFTIDVKKDTDKVSAKALSDKILTVFTEEQKNFYDFQIFLVCTEDEESELYPMIGYKHKTTVNFVWTNK